MGVLNMKLKKARYTLEHEALPLFYFENKKEFISLLLESKGKLLYNIMDDFCDQIGCENLYKKEDYQVDAINVNKKVRIVRATMPDSREALECKYVYFIFDVKFKKMNYFTAEKTEIGIDFLCGWDKRRNHLNYGYCPEDLTKQLEKTIQIYMG